jgi:cell division protein FtsQ
MSIDQRLIERRREVAEDRARRNVSRLVRFLVVLALVGIGVWVLMSPFLSVKEVVVTGVAASRAHEILADEKVVAGRPMILIRPESVADALQRDPWVRGVSVTANWPGTVVVEVEERTPVAWTETGGGWDRRAVDGVVLPSDSGPDGSMPQARLASVPDADAEKSPMVLGALEFAAALPRGLWPGTVIRVEANGELWAEVSGYQVRLGRPIEMEDKALSLAALLAESPARGSILTVIAPRNPAVTPPDAGDDTESNEP